MSLLDVLVPWCAAWGYDCRTATKPPILFFNASDSDALKHWFRGIGGDFLFGKLSPHIMLSTSVSLIGTTFYQSGAKQPAAYVIADERAHYAEHYPNALPLTSASLPAPDAVKERLALLLYPFGTPRDVAERQLHGDSVPVEFVNYLYIRSPRPPLALVGRRARTLTGLFLTKQNHTVYGCLLDSSNARNGLLSMAMSRDKSCADFTVRSLSNYDFAVVTDVSYAELVDSAIRSSIVRLMERTQTNFVFLLQDDDAATAQARYVDSGCYWIVPKMFDVAPTCVANVQASAAKAPTRLQLTAAWLKTPMLYEETLALNQHFRDLHQRLVVNPPPKGSALNP